MSDVLDLMTAALKDLTPKAARHWVVNLILRIDVLDLNIQVRKGSTTYQRSHDERTTKFAMVTSARKTSKRLEPFHEVLLSESGCLLLTSILVC